jgi:hypothetical protein
MQRERLSSVPLRFRNDPRREAMLEPDAVTTILRLKEQGWGTRRIARALGVKRRAPLVPRPFGACGSWRSAGRRDRSSEAPKLGRKLRTWLAPSSTRAVIHLQRTRSDKRGNVGCSKDRRSSELCVTLPTRTRSAKMSRRFPTWLEERITG